MSTLSVLGASQRPSSASGSVDSQLQSPSSGQDFASLMQTGNARSASEPKPAPETRQDTASDTQDKTTSRSEKDSEAQPSEGKPTESSSAQSQAEAGKRKTAAGADEGERAPAEAETASADQTKAKSAGKDSEDAPWPPAGLAGMGMAVLPVVTAVLPTAIATPLAAAGLAINAAGSLLKGIGTLLDGTAASAAPGATAALPAAATNGASAAVANAGFTGLLAQAAAAAQAAAGSDTAAPSTTLTLAGANDSAADSAGDLTVDPTHLLAMATPAPVARGIDSATPFIASPTPTPNLHGDDFDGELGTRMSWLADQKIGHAHIKINPAELGPVEVRLHLSGDQVNASFSSAHADVRQALENSLPKLREMLGQHGFQLGQADVGQQQRQASQDTPQRGSGQTGVDVVEDLSGGVGIPSQVLRYRGLLDAYA